MIPAGSHGDAESRVLVAACRLHDAGEAIHLNSIYAIAGIPRSTVFGAMKRLAKLGYMGHHPGTRGSWTLHVERVADGVPT